MEHVSPRSENTMQEKQEKYPNDWPVITPEQEDQAGPASGPARSRYACRDAEAEASDRSLDRVSAVVVLTGTVVGRGGDGQSQRAVYTGSGKTVEMLYSKIGQPLFRIAQRSA